jgi:hypothetical protein
MVAETMGILPDVIMTDEQIAEFRERFAATMESGYQYRVIPREQFTLDEIRQLLRECVTVVKPGEALAVRMAGLTPQQHREYQQAVTDWHERGDLPFQVFIFIGDELGVVRSSDPLFIP